MTDQNSEILTPDQKLKTQAEGYLQDSQKIEAEENKKAQGAIEDAIIARHQAKTGRKLPTREANLKDALDWQAQEDAEKQAEVERIIRDTEAMAKNIKKLEAAGVIPPVKPTQPNLGQRIIGFVKGLVGRK